MEEELQTRGEASGLERLTSKLGRGANREEAS